MKKIIFSLVLFFNCYIGYSQTANNIVELNEKYATEYLDIAQPYTIVTINGVLYASNKYSPNEPNILIRYPTDRNETEYHIPYYVTRICANAFDGVKLDKLYIPETVRYISYNAFRNSHIKQFITDKNYTSVSTLANNDLNDNYNLQIYNLNGIEVNTNNLMSNNIYIIKIKNKSYKIKIE